MPFLFQILLKKLIDLVKWNDIHLVVQICMDCSGNQQQLLIIPFQRLEYILAEIAGMSLFAVNKKHGAADLAAVLQDRLIQEGDAAGGVPARLWGAGTPA